MIRYYHKAPTHPSIRVFPADSILLRNHVVAPEKGARGREILLSSLNATMEEGERWAYCFDCRQWVIASRLDEREIAMMYAHLVGVAFRVNGHQPRRGQRRKPLSKVIELRMKARAS